LLLRFTVQIPPGERIPGMDKVGFWQESSELPGLANWALAGLHRLRLTRQFTEPGDSRTFLEKLRREANSARSYLAERYQAGPDEVKCEELYVAYRAWCQQSGRHSVSDETFGKEVYRLFPNVERKRRGPRGARFYAYVGLKAMLDHDDDP
jgi:putative DNA primase/helicase